MTKKAEAILEEALKLSPSERLKLAKQIRASVAGDDAAQLSPEWRAEIERRLEGILSGKTKLIPGDKALASVRRALKKQRSSRGKKTGS